MTGSTIFLERHCAVILLLSALSNVLLFPPPATAEEQTAPAGDQPARADDDAQALADTLDGLIAARWTETKTAPAEPADDAEFLHRVSLHVAGCIPSVATARSFLADSAPHKRQRYVDELLDGPGYVVNFTHFWHGVMLPDENFDPAVRFAGIGFDAWLRQQMAHDAPYDEIVRQVINPQFDASANPAPGARQPTAGPTPIAFYQTRQSLPENLAAATSRVFLGIRIECAQCHNHPFDGWKREQFWSLAAFFSGPNRNRANAGSPSQDLPRRFEIMIPDTKTVVEAAFLDGTPVDVEWKPGANPRAAFANWVTSRQNPYFARATANRIWGHFFGIGLVQPVDDISDRNLPSHPMLLDRLAAELAAHNFDIKFLIRAMTLSKTYQLSSRATGDAKEDPQLFARMSVQGLTPAQIVDSLLEATGQPRNAPDSNRLNGSLSADQVELNETFAIDQETTTERETTVLQALALMNGPFIAGATGERGGRTVDSRRRSRTLEAVLNADFLSTEEKIETFYLAALTRKPRPEELQRIKVFLASREKPEERKPTTTGNAFQALLKGSETPRYRPLTDVFWALLNSSEFLFNH